MHYHWYRSESSTGRATILVILFGEIFKIDRECNRTSYDTSDTVWRDLHCSNLMEHICSALLNNKDEKPTTDGRITPSIYR
jgi:hypothetical protein